MDEIREIALRIRELREVCEFTEDEVANRIGVSVETYREYEKTGKDIYAGPASGAMSEAVLLGDFVKDKEHILTVLLDVDERLTGKKYENREAEVDFIFTVKEYENGGGGGGGGGGGVTPATPAEAAKPKTGDDTVIWPYILAVIAAAGIIVAVTVSKKKKEG